MDPREEDELRQLIRKELESRDRMRTEQTEGRAERLSWSGMSEERQRIIEEEIEGFYREKGGYRREVNEEGELEWLTEEEWRERQVQIPVDVEEPEIGQRRVRNRLVLMAILAFAVVALLIVMFRERTGSVQVFCSVPGATILLNGSMTDLVTDARVEGLRAGEHLISVAKPGYVPEGSAATRVQVQAGREEIVLLRLKPNAIYGDTLGRSR